MAYFKGERITASEIQKRKRAEEEKKEKEKEKEKEEEEKIKKEKQKEKQGERKAREEKEWNKVKLLAVMLDNGRYSFVIVCNNKDCTNKDNIFFPHPGYVESEIYKCGGNCGTMFDKGEIVNRLKEGKYNPPLKQSEIDNLRPISSD